MKVFFIICFGYIGLITFPVEAQERVVLFTLTERDRIAPVKIKLEALEAKMDIKFESVNQRIDYIFWLLGIIVALALSILGYSIWYGRTALKPALHKIDLADEKSLSRFQYCASFPENIRITEKLKIHGLL